MCPGRLQFVAAKFCAVPVNQMERIPSAAGVNIFGREWGDGFEALYVGKGRPHSMFNFIYDLPKILGA
jgi:hypothetical protein